MFNIYCSIVYKNEKLFINGRLNKLGYSYIIKYYIVDKVNELKLYVLIWIKVIYLILRKNVNWRRIYIK